MIWRLAEITVFLLALAGCSSSWTEATPEPQIVESGEIQLLPIENRFVAVRDLVLVGGSLWVLDGAPPFVTRVPLEGGKAVQFGGEGEGPGEFLNPWAIQPSVRPDRSGVRVWDLVTLRVSTFDSLGHFVGSERLSDEGRIRARTDIREVSYADPFRVRSVGTDIVVGHFPRRIDRTADLVMGSLRRADSRLEPLGELVRFADHMKGGTSSFREWAAVPLWDVCDGALALWSPASDEIVWMDLQGEVRASAPVREKPSELRSEDIEAYLKWMARLEIGPGYEEAEINYASMAKTYRDRFAEYRPIATDLRCESKGVAWFRLFDTSSDPLGRGKTWMKAGREGTRQKVRFPLEFTPFVFTEGGIFGLLEAPEGHERLAWWAGETTD